MEGQKETLIYMFDGGKDPKELLEKELKEKLIKNDFKLKPRGEEAQTKPEDSSLIKTLTENISKFIEILENSVNISDLDPFFDLFKFMIKQIKNEKTEQDCFFIDICKSCYKEYKRRLSEQKAFFTQDAEKIFASLYLQSLNKNEEIKYKYIMIDGYEDFSKQSLNQIKELSDFCGAKIMAVGNDKESVYDFMCKSLILSGDFKDSLKGCKEFVFNEEYRQPEKSPPEESQLGEGNCEYKDVPRKTEEIIKEIQEDYKNKGLANPKIAIIGKYNKDKDKRFSEILERYKNIEFFTAHKSKGLEFDYVVFYIYKYRNDAKPKSGSLLDGIFENNEDYEARIERVAGSRAKNKVYILKPKQPEN